MVKNEGKKQYSSVELSIYEYNELDVIRTSQTATGTYDDASKEWWDNDVQWRGL